MDANNSLFADNRSLPSLPDYLYSSGNESDFNNFTFGQCEPINYQIVVSLLSQIMYAIVCVVGLLGNTLVIYVVLRFSKMQTVTNMYIVNLAIADECFLIGIPFLITTMILKTWVFGDWMCKVYMITTSINQFTSSIFLLIMSADRYIAVCHPISSPKIRTPFISRIVSIAAWSTSAIIIAPIIIYSTTDGKEGGKYSCNIYWPDDESKGQTFFTFYSFVLGFAIPLLLILIFYCLVLRKLQTVGPKNKSKEKKRSHRKVTKLVLTVITVYIFCWFPYWISQMALIFTPQGSCQSGTTVFLFLMVGCLSYSNSAVNPILYAFLSDNFKKSFLKACTCAAGKEVNATLHMENSVFPRKHKANSERARPIKGPTVGTGHVQDDDEDGEAGPLVSKADHSTSAMTMTSRSNITMSTDAKDSNSKDTVMKNGVLMTLHPTRV